MYRSGGHSAARPSGSVERLQQRGVGDDGLRQRPGGARERHQRPREAGGRRPAGRPAPDGPRGAGSGRAGPGRVGGPVDGLGHLRRLEDAAGRWTSLAGQCPTPIGALQDPGPNLWRWPACASPPPRSTSRWGTWPATSARILAAYEAAEAAGADLVVFPELAVTGYPPEDLLLRPAFVAEARGDPGEDRRPDRPDRRRDRLPAGRARPLQRRRRLRRRRACRASTASSSCPTTASSTRPATSPPATTPVPCSSSTASGWRCRSARTSGAPTGPIAAQAAGGAELAVNINASPYYAGRLAERETDGGHPGRRPLRPHRLRATWSAGRTSSSSTAARSIYDEIRPPPGPGPAVRARTSSSSTSTCGRRSASGSSTPGAGPAARRCPRSTSPKAARRPRRRPPAPASRRRSAPRPRCGGRCVVGTGDYVTQERLRRRRHRPLRRDRLVGGGGGGGRRPRAPST